MNFHEPRWKSYITKTTNPLFTPEQCKMIIEAGRSEPMKQGQVGGGVKTGSLDAKTRTSHISWIPFSKMTEMYQHIEKTMIRTNENHFGFDGMQLTEYAQYTEYPEGGFYDWHMDCDVVCEHEPVIRKISMTCLLSHESEYEGGGLEMMESNKIINCKQGEAVFFASFIRHRVAPVTRGTRKSLVMWFGGPRFR